MARTLRLCLSNPYCASVTQVPDGPTAVIVRQMRELRAARGWSAQRLANEVSAAGLSWDRSIVANLESGRRRTLSVEEWLVVSRVLGIAPLHLLVPVNDADMQVTPQDHITAHQARQWIRGGDPLDPVDDEHREQIQAWVRHRPPDEATPEGRAASSEQSKSEVLALLTELLMEARDAVIDGRVPPPSRTEGGEADGTTEDPTDPGR